MVLEQELLPFLTWLIGYPWTDAKAVLNSALGVFMATALALGTLALVVGFLVALVRHGPLKAGDMTYRVIVNGIVGIVPHVAAPRLGIGPAGGQGIDSPPRRRRVGRVRRPAAVLRLVSQTRLPGAEQAVLQRRADGQHLSRPPDRAVGEHVQPAERFQNEDNFHRRHQAGPRGRYRAGPHPRLYAGRHGAVGDHGPSSARFSCGACWTTPTPWRSPS